MSEHWEPYFDEEKAKAVIRKHILRGVIHRNRHEEVTGIEQFHGEIIRTSHDKSIMLRLNDSGDERWTLPDLSLLEAVAHGNYRLKDSREVAIDPDLLSN